MSKPEKIRALLATALGGRLVVLATDGVGIANDVDAVTIYADDIGLVYGDDVIREGLYLWEGTATLHYDFESINPDGVDYHGTLRWVLPEEVHQLYAMTPTEEEE